MSNGLWATGRKPIVQLFGAAVCLHAAPLIQLFTDVSRATSEIVKRFWARVTCV